MEVDVTLDEIRLILFSLVGVTAHFPDLNSYFAKPFHNLIDKIKINYKPYP